MMTTSGNWYAQSEVADLLLPKRVQAHHFAGRGGGFFCRRFAGLGEFGGFLAVLLARRLRQHGRRRAGLEVAVGAAELEAEIHPRIEERGQCSEGNDQRRGELLEGQRDLEAFLDDLQAPELGP